MEAIVAALAEQQDELAGLLSELEGPDWQRPSRCEGWTVADVVLHLAQTNELAVASAGGGFSQALGALSDGAAGPAGSVDDGAALMVERERGQPGAAVAARWQAGAGALCQVLRGCDPHVRVAWVAGDLSARTLATTRLAETWIHTGDVAAALRITPKPADRLWHIARLAWRTLPYAFARERRGLAGPVAFRLRGPGGDAWDFLPDQEPVTTVRGDATELCLVAARRVDPHDTGLRGEGPDSRAVLELVRTYA
ncbi:MAG TPA: maleylpyruvate isomerase family mycothiol-dependent enzyme [Acidimicrobiales bacterium]|nr:maleylpyruvate isomerase family mycothiol-dependent enzyme [Acidimicrobiales bacterium]